MHRDVRRKCCEHMRANRGFFTAFIDCDFDLYMGELEGSRCDPAPISLQPDFVAQKTRLEEVTLDVSFFFSFSAT